VKKVLTALFILAIMAMSSALDFSSASDWRKINVEQEGYPVAANNNNSVFFLNYTNYDSNGNTIKDFSQESIESAVYDKHGNEWFIVRLGSPGLYRYRPNGDSTVYTTANGLISECFYDMDYDEANDRLVIGTLSGVTVGQISNNGDSISFSQVFSTGGASYVATYNGEIWAISKNNVLWYYDGTSWLSFADTNTDSCLWQPTNVFAAETGDLYAGCTGRSSAGSWIAKYDHATKVWSKIVPKVPDSTGFVDLVVDNEGIIWTVSKYFHKIDQFGGSDSVVPIDGSVYPWLNNLNGAIDIPLNVTKDGHLIIGGKGAIVVANGSSSAVRRQPVDFSIKKQVATVSHAFVVDPLGRMTARNLNSSQTSSGLRFIVTPARSGKLIQKIVPLR
jgi:hypothetical protein